MKELMSDEQDNFYNGQQIVWVLGIKINWWIIKLSLELTDQQYNWEAKFKCVTTWILSDIQKKEIKETT